jgi:predicted phosphodiesterase
MPASPLGSSSLVFVHLSDLHFREPGSALAVREAGLRERLLTDIPKSVGLTSAKQVEAVLLTGDIARSGQQAEYRVARAWLDELCNLLGISGTKTLTCPGNHDVDWNRIDEARRAKNTDLRTCAPHLLDATIDALLEDAVESVLAPLENYNEFASGTACSVERFLAWDLPPLAIASGYRLSIRGATSVVNSDNNDAAGTMAVQTNQLRVASVPGLVRMLLIHHSPYFWVRPVPGPAQYGHHIVLYGHTHEPHHQVINGTCLEITAGAVHPEEMEGFAIPSYNVIEVSIEEPTDVPHDQAVARVRVFHREFSVVDDRFKDSGGAPDIDERVRILRAVSELLPDTQTSQPERSPAAQELSEEWDLLGMNGESEIQPPLETVTGEPDPSRLVRLAFERLGAGDRLRVLDRLGVPRSMFAGLPPHQQIREVAKHVVALGSVDEFLAIVLEVGG